MPFTLDTEFIVAAERDLGCALPASYCTAMARSNGGEMAARGEGWWLHPIADGASRERLRRTTNHVLRETRQMREWPTFPEGALAIATNGSGDALVILREGAGFSPAVWRWAHDAGVVAPVVGDFSQLILGSDV